MMLLRWPAMGCLLMSLALPCGAASVEEDLNAAASQGHVAFILVTDQKADGMDQARSLVKEAMQRVKGSNLVELDRSKAANAGLVDRFRVAAAPVPLILVAAPNGVLAGGLLMAQATVEKLVALVPSPKKAEVLAVLQTGRAAYINASRAGMPAREAVIDSCAAACAQRRDQCVTIEISMEDPGEAEFLAQLSIDRAAVEPVTVVINAQGQITANYGGLVDVASLVQASLRRAGGCCPSSVQGGNSSCAPPRQR